MKLLNLPNIKLLNYNIQLLPWFRKDFSLFDKFVLNYDICCFQEAYPNIISNYGRTRLIRFFTDNGYFCSYCPHSISKRCLIDSGLLTVSKFPIISTYFGEFTKLSSIDRLSNKGYLHNIIKFPGNRMANIINTHTQASYTSEDWFGSGLNQETRLSQFSEIFTYISKIKGNIVLAGDFNISNSDEHLLFVKDSNSLRLGYKIIDSFDGVISNIYIKRTCINHDIRPFSDHLPMAISLTFEKPYNYHNSNKYRKSNKYIKNDRIKI
jgi:hypothetical protein